MTRTRDVFAGEQRLLWLGRIADLAALIFLGFAVAEVLARADLPDRLAVPTLVVLLGVLIGGYCARRSAVRAIRDAKAARESLAIDNRRQDAVRRLGERTLAGLPILELLEAATALVAAELDVPLCGFFDLQSEDVLTLKAGVGWEEGSIGVATVEAGANSHAAMTLRAKAPRVSTFDSGARSSCPTLLRAHRARTEMAAPIVIDGRPIGLIAAYAREPQTFSESDLTFMHFVVHLITSVLRRRFAESELQANGESLRLVLDLTRMGAWDLNLDTGKLLWSRGVYDLLGLEPQTEPCHETFLAALRPEDRDRLTDAVEAARIQCGEFELDDLRICRPDGEVKHVFVRGCWIGDATGNAVRKIGVGLDVTDRRRAQEERDALEEQLRHAQKMEAIGQLAGGIAHDFNNLLLALRGYGEVALRSLTRGQDPRDEIVEMLAAAGRAGMLTRQLLAFSRRQILQAQVIDLRNVVSDMDRLLDRIIGEDVELVTTTPEEAVHVHVDRGQLEQILANLAVNGRDAMPDGGKLSIELSRAEVGPDHTGGMPAGTYALLAVSDTGCGMDTETVARIFEPFFTTKAGIGTGLGLSTVHGIVKQSGGYIWVYSEPGRGTTFKIYLPTVNEDVTEESVPLSAAENGGGETILLVEDDDQVRAIVARMLESHGYLTLAADGGERAVATARNNSVDLLLTDLVMRGLSGRETAERVNQIHPGIAVLYMSGYTDDGVVRRGVLEEGTAFLQKPFGADDLLRKVREVLDAKGAASLV